MPITEVKETILFMLRRIDYEQTSIINRADAAPARTGDGHKQCKYVLDKRYGRESALVRA